jgi:hypothetical protein
MSSFADILARVRTPNQVESFVYDSQPTITLITTEGELELSLTGITPFHTLKEFVREIWSQSKKELQEELFPSRVFFAENRSGTYYPVFFDWIADGQVVGFGNPVNLFESATLQDGDGTELNLQGVERSESREDILLETRYPDLEAGGINFVAFSYAALREAFLKEGRSETAIDAQWDLLFKFFFGKRSDRELRAEIPTPIREQITSAIRAKENTVRILQALVQTTLPDKFKPEAVSVKQLKLYWKNTIPEFTGTDVLFFEAPVTEDRPYMRLVPVSGTPLTKLYQEDPLDTPYVDDPKLLKGWTDEGSPIVNEDILICKVVLGEKSPLIPPIFATLFTLPDATAVFEIIPPKRVKSLQYATDMPALAEPDEFAKHALQTMPYQDYPTTIHTYSCVLRFEFPTLPAFDIRKILPQRLAQLSTLFTKSTVSTDETLKPFLALRYRAVSNFKTKSNLFAFIQGMYDTIVSENPTLNIEQIPTLILPRLVEEFELSQEQARKIYQEFTDEKSRFTLISAEEQEFISKVNLGVTLLFKGYSPTIFDVHCYNISSLETLERIATILKYSFYGSEKQWAAVLQEKVPVEEEEAENEEEEGEEEGEEGDEEEEGEEDGGDEEEEGDDEDQTVAPLISKVRKEAVDPRSWYLNRLYALDAILFKPPKEKSEFSFVQKCAANYDKQPAVLTETEFDRVVATYTKSPRLIKDIPCTEYVKLIVYGVPKTSRMIEEAKGARETIVFLKFGSSSDPKKANYYTCSRLFCLLDVMPLLEADFMSETMVDGTTPKPKRSCPFCGNGLIENRELPAVGQTVLDRRPKPSKPQTAIGFLKDPGHPQGLDVPCCGVKEKHFLWEDEKFSKYKGTKPSRRLKMAAAAAAAPVPTAVQLAEKKEADEQDEEDQDELEDLRRRASGSTNFSMLRFSLNKQYIKGPNIYPLNEGTIGCPQLNVDRLFGQISTDMIARTVVKQEFRTDAQGLFRVGVQNKPYALHTSFFAALAPMLGLNTSDEVSEFFAMRFQPRIFLNLNFGNLVLEFYDPADEVNNGSDDEVNAWGRKYLLTSAALVTSELHRFYNSYKRFIDYIRGQGAFVGKTKQMRHFVHALAEPGLLFPDGLTLMVLQYVGDPRSATVEVKMKCPVLGLDITRYANNQIGILTYSEQGIWEPMIYVDKIQRKDVVTTAQEGYYTITKELLLQDSFPDAIKQQYQAFTTQCRSAFRGAFTYQSGIDNRLLLPVTKVVAILSQGDTKPNGLVRDSYNHLIAVTIPVKGKSETVLVPIVDDGNSFHNNTALQIYIGVHSVPLANAKDVYSTYKTIEPQVLKYNRLYQLTGFQRTDEGVSRFQIGGSIDIGIGNESQPLILPTITLPCKSTTIEDSTIGDIPIIELGPKDKELEYQINRAIRFKLTDSDIKNGDDYVEYSDKKLNPEVSEYLVTREQVENLYEHLRLTFSVWINDEDHAALKETLETRILENRKISDFERLKRLDILLRSTITNWFHSDIEEINDTRIFFRRDCLKIPMGDNNDQSKCTGYCTKGDDGTCKIHIPETVPLGIRQPDEPPETLTTDATDYFCNRLFNELARLPAKRIELMNQKVKKVQVPRTNIHTGERNEQWILPETVPAWDKLLTQSDVLFTEKPQFYEEYSREVSQEEEEAELQALQDVGIFDLLPESLKQYFTIQGQQEILVKLFDGVTPTSDILDYFGLYEYKAKRTGQVTFPTEQFVEKDFYELTRTLKVPVVQIKLEDKTVMAYKSRLAPLTISTYIVIPDFPIGEGETRAGVLITKDQLNPTIPLSFLNPETLPLSSFKTAVPTLKKTVAQTGGAESDGEMMF